MRKILIAAIMSLMAGPALAAGGSAAVLPEGNWSFDGPFGRYDKGAMQRGFQVYVEVCAGCHSIDYIAFRNLADLGYNEAELKAIAAEYEVEDGPDEDGEMYMRPGRLADRIPGPYRNDNEARANNGGALPLDLSLIAKARPNGPNYLLGLLAGYKDAPDGVDVPEGMHYNAVYQGELIAMPQPLWGDDVEYADGSPTSIEAIAGDLAHFLMWAAEPKLEVRKRIGVAAVFFLGIFVVMSYFAKRRIWKQLEH